MRLAVKICAFLLLAFGGVVVGSAAGGPSSLLQEPEPPPAEPPPAEPPPAEPPPAEPPPAEPPPAEPPPAEPPPAEPPPADPPPAEPPPAEPPPAEPPPAEPPPAEPPPADPPPAEPPPADPPPADPPPADPPPADPPPPDPPPPTTTTPPPSSGGGGRPNSPPILSLIGPGGPVEATGPDGAPVFYTVSASDSEDGGITPSCVVPTGTVLPLGETTITCMAKDSDGNAVMRSLRVVVRDTTAPVLTSPRTLEILSATPVSQLEPVIAEWLSFLGASDLADESPTVTGTVPLFAPLGETPIVFTAVDDSGNVAANTVLLKVSPTSGVSPAGPLPDSAKPDVPPRDVTNVKLSYGNLSVVLTWKPPDDFDFEYVAIYRTPGKRGLAASVPESMVYEGAARRYVDTGLRKGRQYRYLLVAHDEGGSRSLGVAVVVVGQANALLAPRHGAEVRRPPRLVWKPPKGASYYNLQLYRRGRKILSLWPTYPAVQLRESWTYAGKRYELGPGLYTWFVWPGLGTKANARYGQLLGQSEFVVEAKAGAPG